MLRFDYDGKHFNAGKGWLVVYRGGKELAKFLDVFTKQEPTKDDVICFFGIMKKYIEGELEKCKII